ncbi:MAG TPA: 6,7-dimethyl-8-ribityllumazine synthase [Candidatus Tectomicrobia bacterium]|nr:6,7-dimethyl-8-ribityllumazine synthase [Candidatus Tectomicrobia bacterium]
MKRIAYIQAAWHSSITDACKDAFLAGLAERGVPADAVRFFSVPGSLEIPLMAKRLARTGRYAAVCASGLVVDGGIYRHDFVGHAVLQGIVRASLETDVPVLSAVLTPHHFHDHAVHEDFLRAHLRTKGHELAEACLAMIDGLDAAEALA